MNNYSYYLVKDGDRFFWAPFLLGGLGGAALVGLSRPRPVYVNPASNYQSYPVQQQPMYSPYPPYPGYYQPPGYMPYYGSSGFNYSGFNYHY